MILLDTYIDQGESISNMMAVIMILFLFALAGLIAALFNADEKGLVYKNRCEMCNKDLTLTESRIGLCEKCENSIEEDDRN